MHTAKCCTRALTSKGEGWLWKIYNFFQNRFSFTILRVFLKKHILDVKRECFCFIYFLWILVPSVFSPVSQERRRRLGSRADWPGSPLRKSSGSKIVAVTLEKKEWGAKTCTMKQPLMCWMWEFWKTFSGDFLLRLCLLFTT